MVLNCSGGIAHRGERGALEPAYNGRVAISDVVRALEQDLRAIFGGRLQSLVVYRPASDVSGEPTPTLAVVDSLTTDDLRACADRVMSWHEAGLATPLLVGTREFGRSLDAFPLEFGAILADHTLVAGPDPFEGLSLVTSDLRRACEVQARSHLLHLREGFIESRGRGDQIGRLIAESAAPLAGLLMSVARLHASPVTATASAAELVERVAALQVGSLSAIVAFARQASLPSSDNARRLFPSYLAAIERLTHYIDQWNGH